jgi:hypothetical protein
MLARTLAAAALVCAAGAAGAQTPAQPLPEAAVAAPPAYRSAFEGYRPYVEEPLAPWREVNDTVGRVGGHVGVLRADESGAPPQPATSGMGTAPAAKEPSHDAHHKK